MATPVNDGKEADMNLKLPILDTGEAKKVASPLLVFARFTMLTLEECLRHVTCD